MKLIYDSPTVMSFHFDADNPEARDEVLGLIEKIGDYPFLTATQAAGYRAACRRMVAESERPGMLRFTLEMSNAALREVGVDPSAATPPENAT